MKKIDKIKEVNLEAFEEFEYQNFKLIDMYSDYGDITGIQTIRRFIQHCNKHFGALNESIKQFIILYTDLEEMISEHEAFIKAWNEMIEKNDKFVQEVKDLLEAWIDDPRVQKWITDRLGKMINEELPKKLDISVFEEYKKFVDDRLSEIIEKTAKTFDVIKNVKNVKKGDIVKTLGYHNVGDMGGETYVVVEGGTVDGGSIIKTNGIILKHIPVSRQMNFEAWGKKPGENIPNTLNDAIEYTAKNGLNLVINKDYDISTVEPIIKADGIYLTDNSHVTIHGYLKVNGEESATFRTFNGKDLTPEYTASNNVILDGTGVIDMGFKKGTAIRIQHAKNVILKGLSVLNINNHHAVEIGGSKNVVVDGMKFNGMINPPDSEKYGETIQIEQSGKGAGGAPPLDETPAKDIVIKNCHFEGDGICENHVAIGSHSELRGTVVYDNIKILNNTFIGVNKQVIVPNDWRNVVISGNTVKDCKHAFIGRINYKANSIENGVISNNVIEDNGSNNTDVNEVLNENIFQIYVAKNLTISNNSVINATMGIATVVSSQQVNFIGNSFIDYASSNTRLDSAFITPVWIRYFSDVPKCSAITFMNNVFRTKHKHTGRVYNINDSTLDDTYFISGNVYEVNGQLNNHVMRQIKRTRRTELFKGNHYYGKIGLKQSVYHFDFVVIEFRNSDRTKTMIIDLEDAPGVYYNFTDLGVANSSDYVRFGKIDFDIVDAGSTIDVLRNVQIQGTLSKNNFEVVTKTDNTDDVNKLCIRTVYGYNSEKSVI